MNEDMKKYWEKQLLKMAEEKTLFESTYPVTWKQRLHNRYLEIVDRIYELLTGSDPHEE